MTHPDPRSANDPVRRAPAGAAGGPTRSEAEGGVVNPEAAFGGADAVEKTSYGVGHGTDPGAHAPDTSTAHPRGGTGPNYLAWGVGAITAVVAIVYLLSLLS